MALPPLLGCRLLLLLSVLHMLLCLPVAYRPAQWTTAPAGHMVGLRLKVRHLCAVCGLRKPQHIRESLWSLPSTVGLSGMPCPCDLGSHMVLHGPYGGEVWSRTWARVGDRCPRGPAWTT